MADVFISYSRKDYSRISVLAERLEHEGFSVWWDPEIPPGMNYQLAIFSALEAAACVIVAWSSASVASEYVQSEAEAARVRGALVPVFIEMVPIPVPFNLLQGVRLVEWDGDPDDMQWRRLVKAVRQRSPGSPTIPDGKSVVIDPPIGPPVEPPVEPPIEPPDTAAGLPLGPGVARLLEEAA
ncbi:MAG: toll/interleukin-1 receptor domain-containing protein, partial [Acidimicrobiia bacterium]|nr:toll/interleukin-1 receptor domain-containing protein [Acidimicrobiia bacterium]